MAHSQCSRKALNIDSTLMIMRMAVQQEMRSAIIVKSHLRLMIVIMMILVIPIVLPSILLDSGIQIAHKLPLSDCKAKTTSKASFGALGLEVAPL